jgi:hypothetical protein
MLNLIAILMGLAADAPVVSATPVLSECDAHASALSSVALNAPLDVHYAIENAPTCYSVTLTVAGKPVRGFVLNRKLDAVIAFEKSRVDAEREAFSRPIPMPVNPSAPPPAPSVKETERPKAEVAKAEKKSSKPDPKVTFN